MCNYAYRCCSRKGENGDVVAVLKKTAKGDLYYEAKKDAILPAYSHLLGIK